jgi:hypothetical protein
MVQDHDFVARREPGIGGLDLVAEDPGMPGAKPALLVLREADGRVQGLKPR